MGKTKTNTQKGYIYSFLITPFRSQISNDVWLNITRTFPANTRKKNILKLMYINAKFSFEITQHLIG